MRTALLWGGLFLSTALTDWLSAKWVGAASARRRAHISALHEFVALSAGFLVYTKLQDFSLVVPCVLGAWAGSYLSGDRA